MCTVPWEFQDVLTELESETALLDCAGSWGFNKVEKKDAVGLGRFEVESNQSPRIGKNDCAMLLGLRETL